MTEEALFHEALARATPQERAAFLDVACAGQPQLRAAVEALLAAHTASGHPLDQPPLVSPRQAEVPGGPTVEAADRPTRTYAPPEVQPGLVIAGRYTLVEKVGEGGMGEVWVARQTEPVKRRVALKLIKPGMDSRTVVQRFEQERQALAVMDHPHIARVFDGGLTGDRRPFFAMELVNGLPLTTFCDEAKLGIRARLELFVPICQAVQHAHQKGIVHRDLKPSNILVTLIDGQPIPKIIDFGVAKALGDKLSNESLATQFGAVIGTLDYMSPEQASFSGADIDTRADVYSLGVILYELLTGLRPFDRRRLRKAAFDEMIRMIREEEPSKPSTRLSTDGSSPSLAAVRQMEPGRLTKLLRGDLDWVVMKCLEKQRDRRYETASGLARDVQRYLADEAVEARPPSAGYRLRKFVRRRRGPVAAAAVVLAVLLAGIAGTTWGLVRAERSRARAVEAGNAEAEQRQAAEASTKQVRESAEQLRLARNELEINLYGARANLIQASWEAHAVTRLRELLDEQKPRSGERDLRGFEWHYWDRRAHAELTVGPPASDYEKARVSTRLLSPDGRRQAILWACRGNEQGDQSLSKIEVRDALTGAEVTSFNLSIPLAGRPTPFTYPHLAFTTDGEGLFATWIPEGVGGTSKLHWWLFDAATGKELVSHQQAPCDEPALPLVWPDRNLVATPLRIPGPVKGVQLKLWSVARGQEVRTCEGTCEAIQQAVFRPGGKEVAAVVSSAAGTEAQIKVWDTSTGRNRLTLPAGSGYVGELAWSPDGRRLAVPAVPFRIWDTADGRELLALTEPEGPPSRVVFSPDGGRVACVDPYSPSRYLTLRETATGRTRVTFKIPEESLYAVAFSADGTRLVTLARFGTVRTWDATVNELPVDLPFPADSPFANVGVPWDSSSLNADGTRIAVSKGSKELGKASLQVWHHTGESLLTSTRPWPPDQRILAYSVSRVALSPDGGRVAWVYGTGWGGLTEPKNASVRLTVIDVTSRKDLWSRDFELVGGPLQFSADGRQLIAYARPLDDKKPPPGGIMILDVESGREVYSFQTENFFSTGNGNLLAGLQIRNPEARERLYPLKVWDLRTRTEMPTGNYPPDLLETPGLAGTALSPDGTRLALAWRGYETGDSMIRMLEIPSGRELRPLKGLDSTMSALAFSPDGTRLAAAGHTVRIWDPANGQELITLRDPSGGVSNLAFSQDGHRLRALVWRGRNYAVKNWDATPRARK
jgi:WD40 repeat protein/tRNA A-37 threonylcarbamoyl transferase component Bud32